MVPFINRCWSVHATHNPATLYAAGNSEPNNENNTHMTQQEKATVFHQLHTEKTLVLPNAWDAASAKIVEKSGARAVATTSAGVSWSKGMKDGEALSRTEMLRSIEEIVSITSLPVTVDIESGYGNRTPSDVAETVRLVLEAGAVGINLEDTPGYEQAAILEPEEQAERIRQARKTAHEAGIDLFINARTDIYMAAIGEPATRFDAVLDRAAMYLEAGASGIFVPALKDLETIAALSNNIGAPLNIMGGRGATPISTLQEAGVARISLGPFLALACFSVMRKLTKDVLQTGSF